MSGGIRKGSLAFTKQRDDKFKEVLFQLDELKTAIEQKRPEIANRKGVVFHQDNAQPHVSLITRQKLLELGWDVLPQPPYSPDLAPLAPHTGICLFASCSRLVISFCNIISLQKETTAFHDSSLRNITCIKPRSEKSLPITTTRTHDLPSRIYLQSMLRRVPVGLTAMVLCHGFLPCTTQVLIETSVPTVSS